MVEIERYFEDIEIEQCKQVLSEQYLLTAQETSHLIEFSEADLIEHLSSMNNNLRSERVIVGICGFPGSGKTTLTNRLRELSNQKHKRKIAAILQMDGFHYPNHVLVEKGLFHLKGAPLTYNVENYIEILRKLKFHPDSQIKAPIYDRKTHEVVSNAHEIGRESSVIITEGNYIGLDTYGWAETRNLVDSLCFLDTPIEVCFQRIVRRNEEAGRTQAEIHRKLKNDCSNMHKILTIMPNASIRLTHR